MMSNKHTIIFLILISLAMVAKGQGGRTLPFLYFNSDVRSAGMGESVMGESKGMYMYTNPTSFLGGTEKAYGSYTYGLFPPAEANYGRLNYHAASVGYKLRGQAVMAGFRSLGGLSVPQIGEDGMEKKPVEPKDMAMDLAYTRLLGECFSAWVRGSFIYSYIGKTAYTGAVSGGAHYRNTLSLNGNDAYKYVIGAAVYDIGGKVNYGKSAYDLPSSFGIGGSIELPVAENHHVNVALDTRYFLLPANASELTGGVGAEYELFGLAAIRAGYQWGKMNSHTTLGMGFNLKQVNIDVAYAIAHETTGENLWRFGIGFKF